MGVLFANAMLFGFQVTLIGTPIIGVLPIDAHRFEQGFEFLEHFVLASTQYIGQYGVGLMVQRIPKPTRVGLTTYIGPRLVKLRLQPNTP